MVSAMRDYDWLSSGESMLISSRSWGSEAMTVQHPEEKIAPAPRVTRFPGPIKVMPVVEWMQQARDGHYAEGRRRRGESCTGGVTLKHSTSRGARDELIGKYMVVRAASQESPHYTSQIF